MRVGYKPHIRYFARRRRCVWRGAKPQPGWAEHRTGRGPGVLRGDPAGRADLLDAVLRERRADRERVAQHADRVARAAYEVALARRQYDVADPDNRSGAATGMPLGASPAGRSGGARGRRPLRGRAIRSDLDAAMRAQLHDVGRQLPTLWASGSAEPCAQEDAAAHPDPTRDPGSRPQRRPDVEIVVRVSGAFSVLEAHPPIHRTPTSATTSN